MTTAAPARTRRDRAGLVALAAGDAVMGLVGAVAAVLWWFTARGIGQRFGWVRPDPTLYRDGMAPWILPAAVVTAVDLALVLAVHLLVGRTAPRGGRLLAVGVHLLVAVVLATAYLGR